MTNFKISKSAQEGVYHVMCIDITKSFEYFKPILLGGLSQVVIEPQLKITADSIEEVEAELTYMLMIGDLTIVDDPYYEEN